MKKTKKRRQLNISQLIALVFLGVILVGALLLCLPFASRSGRSCGFLTALFTATSSTCVTGLILRDTWTQWSGFGQAVLLCLIEIGGMGFMSAVSMVIFAFRKKMSMSQQLLIAQSIGAEETGEAVSMQKKIIAGCLSAEAVGAAALTVRFMKEYPFFKALRMGVFHAVSAFCNAGFDILGFREEGSSVMTYGTDIPVVVTLALLIIVGGIGFLVWDEIVTVRSPKKWSVYTKLVLITTAILLFGGMILTLLTEWNNPGTLGNMTIPEKLTAAFFQSATLRTAGFAGIDQGALTDGGKAVSMFLMLIGGSSGSTAGGLKTVTFIVLMLFIGAKLRGKEHVTVFKRTIPEKSVMNALTMFGAMTVLAFAGAAVLCSTSPVSFTDSLYETVSAIATVGLTTGITPILSVPAKLLIIVYMYFGRVGIMTVSLGFLQDSHKSNHYKYAETSLLIG